MSEEQVNDGGNILDPEILKDGAGLVRSHEISGDTERVVMRTGADLRDLINLQDELDKSCDDIDKAFSNMFRYKVQQKRYYNNGC